MNDRGVLVGIRRDSDGVEEERGREIGVVRRSGGSIFTSARVESRHTRPQVG